MFKLTDLMRVYREEEGGDSGTGGGSGDPSGDGGSGNPDVKGPDSLLGDNNPDASAWLYADGVTGTGDKPEFLLKKFKTVSDQAKSYVDLQKRFGGFTGAPDSYELKTPEGIEGEINADDPVLKQFMETAKAANMNQETFDELTGLYLQSQVQTVDINAVKAEIGQNADARVANVSDFLRANLESDDVESLSALVNDAGTFKALEKLIQMGKPKKLPSQGGENPQGMTADKLEEMQFAVDENGVRKMQNPEYAKQFRAAMTAFYGDGPDVGEVG